MKDCHYRSERATMGGEKIATVCSILWSDDGRYATGVEVAECRRDPGDGWKPRNAVRIHHRDCAAVAEILRDVAAEACGHLI